MQKFTIARDSKWYFAFPDLLLTKSGTLLCSWTECTHHSDRSHSRILLAHSSDHGRSWSAPVPLTEATDNLPFHYNCSRMAQLRDGRIALSIDKITIDPEHTHSEAISSIFLYFSQDDGNSWSQTVATGISGIMPDKLTELPNGRWLLGTHKRFQEKLTQYVAYSDNLGETWTKEVIVARDPNLNLCEVSMVPAGGKDVIAFMRENSGLGYDCKKVISHDYGSTWGPVIDFPIPGCHRPTAGWLQDGHLLITCRFMQGGKGWLGTWMQNTFACLSDRNSALATSRKDAWTRILPIEYDRSPVSDGGYTGWVQFPNGEIYIANYCVDDNDGRGQIRGYALTLNDFLLPTNQ